jgi:hypothetical protein
MKIQSEHYEHMKSAISAVAVQHPVADYRTANPTFTDMRVRWDYCHAAGLTPWTCANLYSYMNDEHIDTALRHIFTELQCQ